MQSSGRTREHRPRGDARYGAAGIAGAAGSLAAHRVPNPTPGPYGSPGPQELANPCFQGAAARSMDVGRTGEYHRENRVFPVVGDSYRPTTKIGDAVRKCGKHYYTICELHGSEMSGREINKLATDLISKIFISR